MHTRDPSYCTDTDTTGKQATATFWALSVRSELGLLVLTMVLMAPNKLSYSYLYSSRRISVSWQGALVTQNPDVTPSAIAVLACVLWMTQ